MKFREWVKRQYEAKKVNLLHVHRKGDRRKEEIKLVHEINAIAKLIKKPVINIDNISETLRVYPALLED